MLDLFTGNGLVAGLLALVVALGGALWASVRSGGKKSAQLDEAERMQKRNEEQAEKVQESIRERIRHEDVARTTPIADVDAHPSMRDRRRG